MKSKPLWLKWILCIFPAVIAAAMYLLLPHFPRACEYVFTRGIFRIVAFPLEWLVSILPFSLTEAAVVLGIPALFVIVLVWVIRIIRRSDRLSVFERGIRFAAACLSAALLLFMITDGANFYRLPLGELLELPCEEYTADDLYELTCYLADNASESRQRLCEDENGCAVLSVKRSELLKKTDECYDGIKKSYPFLKTQVWRIKPVVLSHLWSYTGTTGVYCPWLLEASVNVDVPDYELAHTAAHELAHTMGFAKENECNFLAWLACATCKDPDFEYSGHLQAYIYCSNALYKADKELWLKARSHCSEGMIRDMRQSADYWDSFEGEVMESSQNFNDSFIKANGVESGVLSYNEMVELMLRYYSKIK